jgi:hypothetical protein
MDPQEAKTIANFLVADFENEIQTTLRVIEAVPDGQLDYQPDPKSKTGLGLVRHLALEDEWILGCIANGAFVPPPDDSDACGIMNAADGAARYREKVPAALARVRAISGGATGRHHRPDGHEAGARGRLAGDGDQALGPPPRPAQQLSARHGRQGARHLRPQRRYPVTSDGGQATARSTSARRSAERSRARAACCPSGDILRQVLASTPRSLASSCLGAKSPR